MVMAQNNKIIIVGRGINCWRRWRWRWRMMAVGDIG